VPGDRAKADDPPGPRRGGPAARRDLTKPPYQQVANFEEYTRLYAEAWGDPDVRWLRRESDIAQLAAQQARLLGALWPLLKPGGRLVYCTCSVFRTEGEGRIAAFLAHNSEARLRPGPGHLLPGNGAKPGGVPDK